MLNLIPGKKIGIDLGTVNTVGAIDGRVIFNEPTVVVYRTNKAGDIKESFFGHEALKLSQFQTEGLVKVWPIVDGKVSDPHAAEDYVKLLMKKVEGNGKLVNQIIVLAIACNLDASYKREALAVCQRHAREVALIDQPVAAALANDIDMDSVGVVKTLDIGGGTTDVAVIALGGKIPGTSASICVAGNKFDEAIQDFVSKKYGIRISADMARDVKHAIGSALCNSRELAFVRIKGYDRHGEHKSLRMETTDVAEAMREPLVQIAKFTKNWFGEIAYTHPEVLVKIEESRNHQGDISKKQEDMLLFTGGGSLLKDLDVWFSEELGIPVRGSKQPLLDAALGACKAARDRKLLERFRVPESNWGVQLSEATVVSDSRQRIYETIRSAPLARTEPV